MVLTLTSRIRFLERTSKAWQESVACPECGRLPDGSFAEGSGVKHVIVDYTTDAFVPGVPHRIETNCSKCGAQHTFVITLDDVVTPMEGAEP